MKKLIFVLIAFLALNSFRTQWLKMPNEITTNKIVYTLASKGDTVISLFFKKAVNL